jgi:hypothetical protein
VCTWAEDRCSADLQVAQPSVSARRQGNSGIYVYTCATDMHHIPYINARGLRVWGGGVGGKAPSRQVTLKRVCMYETLKQGLPPCK